MSSGARIKFPGNPWPKGHAIKKAVWSAVLAADGLHCHLHVESADYYADDDRDDPEEAPSDWESRTVWGNYHACKLSSTMWGHRGFQIAAPGKPVDLERLEGKTFRIDPIVGKKLKDDVDLDDFAFGIYLLGHDSVADHKITFVKRRGPRTYDLRWRAQIALTYAGNYALEHSLDATLFKLQLAKIAIDKDLETKAATALLPAVLVGASRYKLGRRAFVPS